MRAEPTNVARTNFRRSLALVLRDAGHEAWLVGGCVRDLLRGVAIVDYDVTTAASAAELVALFPRAVPIGVRHGTVMVPTSAGPVDVTAFRGATLAQEVQVDGVEHQQRLRRERAHRVHVLFGDVVAGDDDQVELDAARAEELGDGRRVRVEHDLDAALLQVADVGLAVLEAVGGEGDLLADRSRRDNHRCRRRCRSRRRSRSRGRSSRSCPSSPCEAASGATVGPCA